MDVILFFYGLAFFCLAMVVLVQPKEESRHELSKIMWLLVIFGFTHGALEWMELWANVHDDESVLETWKVAFLFVSFLFLFAFGRRLILATPVPDVVRRLLGTYIYSVVALGFLVELVSIPDWMLAIRIASRYFLGGAGSLLTAAGFFLYYQMNIKPDAESYGLAWARKYFILAAVAFVFYGLTGGLVVPMADAFPANVINDEWFLATFGAPVGLYRAASAIIAVAAIINILRVFTSEAREKLKRSAALAAAQHISHTGSWEWNLQDHTSSWSDETYLIFGIPKGAPGDLRAQLLERVHPEDRAKTAQAMSDALKGIKPYDLEYRVLLPDGAEKVVHARAGVTRDRYDTPVLVRGTVQDITERKEVEESMRLAALIYQSSAEAVMVTDEHNRIIDVNPAFVQQTGYTLEEVLGQNPNILKSGRHDKAFYQEMWRSILETDKWAGEVWDRRKDGSLYAKHASINVIRHPDGRIYRHVAQFLDITYRKQKEEQIWRQANFDMLTELPNRRLFHDRLEQETKKAHRTGLSMALLFIDLDRFKEINDSLGHAKGDILLVEAARRISACVRESDTVARLGGDEFTVILTEFSERLHLERIAQDMIQALSKPFDLGGGDAGYISASIGIALYPDDAKDMEELLKHADQAMYAAKAEGRSRFCYFIPSMQMEAREKLTLTNDLRQALARNELEVYYQPIVDTASGLITKAEALLRWRHPTRGMVSPATFIPLAEESGLILEIGDWVFQQAIVSIERCRKKCGRIIQVSVNMSPLQFEQAAKPLWIDSLAGAGLPGNSITVEITEGLLIKDSAKVKQHLLELRNSGVEVSIDDFGTGFSALSYLKQFDIDYLKIDRSFVSHLVENESDKALTEAIIVMAHKLGIKVVAEGVETKEQLRQLIGFGCDYVQGYLYSLPLPAEEFEKFLDK